MGIGVPTTEHNSLKIMTNLRRIMKTESGKSRFSLEYAEQKFKGKTFKEIMDDDISPVKTPKQKKEMVLFEMMRAILYKLYPDDEEMEYFIEVKRQEFLISTKAEND